MPSRGDSPLWRLRGEALPSCAALCLMQALSPFACLLPSSPVYIGGIRALAAAATMFRIATPYRALKGERSHPLLLAVAACLPGQRRLRGALVAGIPADLLPPAYGSVSAEPHVHDGSPDMQRTKGQVEAEISKAIVKFEREYMGRGPTGVKTSIVQDMVLVRLTGVLTPAEEHLVKLEGVELIKQVRSKLLESGRERLAKNVQDIIGLPVISMHSDLSTKTGERIIILVFGENIEEKFS